MRKPGFTLMELIMVVALSVIIMTPAYRIFRSGSQASLQGMQQLDMVQEGRRIIRQLHSELKLACCEFPPTASVMPQLTDILPSPTTVGVKKYSFLSFPLHAEIADAVSERTTSGEAPRLVNRITYYLEPSGSAKNPFQKLIREEAEPAALGGKTSKTVLTERINFFSIRPIKIENKLGPSQWFFNITLQLGEARHPDELKNVKTQIQMNRTNGLVLADFFDIVYPDYFCAMNNQDFIFRNWYTNIKGPKSSGAD